MRLGGLQSPPFGRTKTMPFVSQAYLKWLQVNDFHEYTRLTTGHMPLGYHQKTHDTLYLAENERFGGMYVLGMPGMGKSGFLETLIDHDVRAGNAVVVIDPHGDLVDHCIAALPPERVAKTYVLDMLDEFYPFGVNLFQTAGAMTTEVARARAVERIVRIFNLL